jgi:hypothetical protein
LLTTTEDGVTGLIVSGGKVPFSYFGAAMRQEPITPTGNRCPLKASSYHFITMQTDLVIYLVLCLGTKIKNLTTAASIWYGAAIGMALGFNMHAIAILASLYAVAINRIPHVKKYNDE